MIFNVLVDGHSILRTPAAWRNRESKAAPCGGGQLANAVPMAVADGATTINAQWDVTAGDGNGPITVSYVTTDTTNFGGAPTLAVTMDPVPQRGTGQYPFTLNVAALNSNVCNGGADGNTCHIQVKSTSNWYSCASLSMTAPVTPPPTAGNTAPPTPPPTPIPPVVQKCEPISGVTGTLCGGLAGKNVFPPENINSLITAIGADYQGMRNNPLVFRNPSTTLCGQYLAQIFCAFNIRGCDVGTPPTEKKICKTRCTSAFYECDVDPYHTDAYLGQCELADFGETTADVYGTCPVESSRVVHLKNLLVGNEPDYWVSGQRFLNKNIYKGDQLTWKWKSPSTLFQFSDRTAFENCNFQGATPLTGMMKDGFNWYTFDTNQVTSVPDITYYGSNPGCVTDATMVANNNLASQKFGVQVIATPEGARVVPFGQDDPAQEIPAVPPTAGVPGFLGNPQPLGGSSVGKIQLTFAAIICTFLMVFL